jgi:uncharacterized membrane protein YhaH (DUF805 family)
MDDLRGKSSHGFGQIFLQLFGRVNRAKYWIGMGIAWVLGVLPMAIATREGIPKAAVVFGWLYIWTSFAIAAKRLLDLDMSGWWVLVWFAIGLLFGLMPLWLAVLVFCTAIFWLGSARGTKGTNRFGPEPIPLRQRYSQSVS